ncbi:MAG: LuxR C-terminal-related transcriptional regulator [Actinomycetota bacterium]|nr:LuxR C-terminal-related transcriptional regulator [Actinomycetota bacterium]
MADQLSTRRLPRPRTSFIGREPELTQARELLAANRLLTVTGPGGSGKTRFAIALAGRAVQDFSGGVRFVALAAIKDPVLVPVSIAQGIGMQDSRGGTLLDDLSEYITDLELLLVLDNFEQVIAAGEFVQGLLAECPRLRIVVTSRTPLHLVGEQLFPLPPLRLPEQQDAAAARSVAVCESAQLFAARAGALAPGFTIDDHNARAVAGILARLDGLPLAIELAAARVTALSPDAILARLERSLGLLVARDRDVPDRQRTLRATIAWSHDLLSEPARHVFAACSVFRGGIGLSGLEAACADALDAPVIDAVQELVDHGLLRLAVPAVPVPAPAEPRYAMLETVREFATEKLGMTPEARAVHAAHAEHFLQVAAALDRPPLWPDRWGLDLLELDSDNFRAALDWFARQDPRAGLLLANRLTAFWSARGHFSEGRQRLTTLLDLAGEDDPEWVQGMNGLAWLAADQGDYPLANALLERSIARAHAIGDLVGEGTALFYRGRSRGGSGEYASQTADIARALELQTAAGNEPGVAAATWFSGLPLLGSGDFAQAAERFEKCAELSAALEIPALGARALQLLGVCRIELGELDAARDALAAGVPAIVDIGEVFAIPVGLGALAGLAAKAGRPKVALMLAGAASEYERVNHTDRPRPMRTLLDAWLAPVYDTLGADAAVLLGQGSRLSPDEAVELGLAVQPENRPGASVPGLTRREAEVAVLVAQGLSNREVAAKLYVSVRTVEVHVDHILTKLGFRSRTQLAAWAHQQGLMPRNT